MERDTETLVELGSVTCDTAGDWGLYVEAGGRMPTPGLSQD